MSAASDPAAAASTLDARLAALERRSRALALAVAVLAPATATLALAAFRRPPQPPTLEGERLVLRAADAQASTVVIEPSADGGVRIRAGRLAPIASPAHAVPGAGAALVLGAELSVTSGPQSTALELRDANGRTVFRLGASEARPARP